MNKFAMIENSSNKINKTLLDSVLLCGLYKNAISDFINDASIENSQEIENIFANLYSNIEQLKNTTITLTKQIYSEDGLIEDIDGIVSEDGTEI